MLYITHWLNNPSIPLSNSPPPYEKEEVFDITILNKKTIHLFYYESEANYYALKNARRLYSKLKSFDLNQSVVGMKNYFNLVFPCNVNQM